jgi:hypothetical protein
MKTIWKFVLDPEDLEVSMPAGAQILTVREQGVDRICAWALVDPNEGKKELRSFNVYGTGHVVEGCPGRYLGAAMLNGGSLVLHVFEASEGAT